MSTVEERVSYLEAKMEDCSKGIADLRDRRNRVRLASTPGAESLRAESAQLLRSKRFSFSTSVVRFKLSSFAACLLFPPLFSSAL